ncbi:MAG: PASTA domain-containing protein [Pseudomonadota bacterium]
MKRTFRILLFLAAFTLAAGAAGYGALQFLFFTADRVVVPNLTDRGVVWTLEVLTGLGLNTKVTGRVHDDRVPENHVLSQDPEPGREIKKGRDVRIVISAGPREIVLPDLVFRTLAGARIVLEDEDLVPGHLARARAPAPEGTVLAQFPMPGTRVVRGAAVDLLVCDGPAETAFAMPDLTGKSADGAALASGDAGLVPGRVETASDPSVPANVVVDQSPGFGYRVCVGAALALTVNRPRAANTAPDGPPRRFIVVRTPPGFLKTRIRLVVDLFGQPLELHDQALPPDGETWFLIPPAAEGRVWLYRDGRRVDLEEDWADRLLIRAMERIVPLPEVPIPGPPLP